MEKQTKFERPWGWYDSITQDDGYQVKIICVHPAQILSLQKHMHRSEHWVVVRGTAWVTVDGAVLKQETGSHVYIPLEAKHRLENRDDSDLYVIEVQCGAYLGEDDIIRFEDKYHRKTSA